MLRGLYDSCMAEVLTTLEMQLPETERQFIIDALVGYNDSQAPKEAYTELAVVSRQDGKMVGGLLGFTHWNWLFIKQLWVAEGFRGNGIGRELMQSAQREAGRRGCLHASCDTFDFPALGFYQKLGFSVFGTLADFPAGHARYFLQKRNISAPYIDLLFDKFANSLPL